MAFFKKRKKSRTVSCEEARDRVLLTGGLRIVCPDDDKENGIVIDNTTIENKNDQQKNK